jgi:hypothetical protein
MNQPNKKRNRIPRLLQNLGPAAVEKIGKFRLYVKACEGYQRGAKSLHQAFRLGCNADDVCWQTFRDSAFRTEDLISRYFENDVDLFEKLGEGLPWIGLTDHGILALELVQELISWYDNGT